ncbi:MAG: acyloxyacyl hydrolase [Gemmatimonadetes bacterium]|nr:acyloxyacyl hydrolase [Gemmatimonadota bacterium]
MPTSIALHAPIGRGLRVAALLAAVAAAHGRHARAQSAAAGTAAAANPEAALPVPATPAGNSAADSSRFGTTQFAIVVGSGGGHVTSRYTGVSVPGRLTIIEIRLERTMLRGAGLDLRYGAALLPLVSIEGQEIFDNERWSCGGGPTPVPPTCARPRTPMRTASGVGIVPVFVRLGVAPAPWMELFASARAGIASFHRSAPLGDRGSLAPLVGGGAGVAFTPGDGPAVVLEYDVLQMSNGGMTVDSPVLVVPSLRLGIAWRRQDVMTVPGDSSARPRLEWNAAFGVGDFRACGYDGTASLALLTVRRDGRLAGSDRAELRVGFEAVPLAIAMRSGGPLSGTSGTITPAVTASAVGASCGGEWGAGSPDVGIGFSPVAIRGIVRGGSRTRAYFDLSGGGIILTRDFPSPGARGLNFLLAVGAGLELAVSARESFVIGYRLEHVSNGYTARVNPGINLHTGYLGLSRRR